MSDTNASLPKLTGEAEADYFEGLYETALKERERQLADTLRRLAEVERERDEQWRIRLEELVAELKHRQEHQEVRSHAFFKEGYTRSEAISEGSAQAYRNCVVMVENILDAAFKSSAPTSTGAAQEAQPLPPAPITDSTPAVSE